MAHTTSRVSITETIMQAKRTTAVAAILIVAACCAGFCQVAGKKPQASGPEQEVRQLLDELREAQIRHDTAALDRIYADDYTLTEDDGTVFTKLQRIAAIRALEFASSEVAHVRVRIYNGDTAVINYRAEVRFRVKPTGPFRGQVTSVAVKRQGRWQFVASHESSLRPNR